MALSIISPPSEVIRDLRRALIIRQVEISSGLSAHAKVLNELKHSDVESSHVYDIQFLLDGSHAAFIGMDNFLALLKEAGNLQAGIGLFLPHPRTCFISRWIEQRGDGIYLHVIIESNDELISRSFFYLVPKEHWFWLGAAFIAKSGHGHPQDGVVATMVADENYDRDKNVRSLVSDPVAATVLLLQKSDTVVVEPAPWWPSDESEPIKLKAFQTPNPSVAVVRINTPRILVRPPRDDDGSGHTVRGHDVRSHLRRRGRKVIQVRAHTRNGGPNAAVTKVIKIDKPL